MVIYRISLKKKLRSSMSIQGNATFDYCNNVEGDPAPY